MVAYGKTVGVSGIAATLVVGGGIVMYSGIRNATVADTLRALLKGQAVTGSSSGSLSQSQTAIGTKLGQIVTQAAQAAQGATTGHATLSSAPGTGGRVVAAARAYLGVPYRLGGADPTGMDCSGLINRVLGHDLGLPIPGSGNGSFTGHGPGSLAYYSWTGATTVSSNPADAAPGDLVCWPGHIGIASGGGMFIAAPSPGRVVVEERIYAGPLIRRPNSYA